MQDAEVVAAIVAGQADGLAEAYDRYAPALHAYCRSLLGEPADADDAVLDTFLIAAGQRDGLRASSRLRPWLYAVARNECRRRLRSRASSAPLDEVSDDTIDLGVDAASLELRALVDAALAGLSPRDREIIELNLHHELARSDLAAALGVTTKQARALASRARSQFGTSLGVLLVARTGRESCPELAAILTGWDGRLNVLLRKRINRHIEHCARCGAHRRDELSAAMVLSALPIAPLPAGLRDRLLLLAADAGPDAAAYRAAVISRAGPFGPTGFPIPLDPPRVAYGVKSYALAATAGAAALAVAATMLYGSVLRPAGPHSPAAAGPAETAGAGPHASAGAGTQRPSGPPGTIPLAAGATANPTAAVSPAVAVTPRVTTSHRATPSARPSLVATSSPSPSPVAGTLTTSVTVLHLRLNVAASFTLTAQGGPVSRIRIENPDPLDLTVSLGTRSLAAGQTTTVTVVMVNPLGSSSSLLVHPGGTAITVRPALFH
jgi:RNA polymerase sigma factor (sigma-70 family)